MGHSQKYPNFDGNLNGYFGLHQLLVGASQTPSFLIGKRGQRYLAITNVRKFKY